MSLAWGRHYLMCPPDYFGVLYEINPWMRASTPVDADKSMTQWQALANTLVEAGATVEALPPAAGHPDLVFTANAGLVNGRQFVPSRFFHPQRQGETALDRQWFEGHSYEVSAIPEQESFEGAGDALPYASALLAGYGPRTSLASHDFIAKITGSRVYSLQLTDERLYHLDLCFCPLDDEHALVAPLGLSRESCQVLEQLVPRPLLLETEEALAFCANSVVVDDLVIMGSSSPRVARQLESWGFSVVVCEVSEFVKAGGGCRCLTIALDVRLAQAGSSSALGTTDPTRH